MNFRPELAALVLSGEKTVTRRLASDNPRSPWYLHGCKLTVGRDYAVCPGRGKPALARVVVTDVRLMAHGRLSEDEARREGFASADAFDAAFAEINGDDLRATPVWRIEMRLLGVEQP